MKGIITLVLFIHFVSVNWVQSQEQSISSSSILWEISSDSSETSYLFGTMHLMREDSFYFPDTLEQLLDESDVLVMELNGELFDPSLLDLMILEEGDFFDFFTPEQLDSIYAFAEEKLFLTEELFRSSFEKMKPFVVSQVFAMFQVEKDDTTYMDTRSHEIEFNEKAAEDSIELIGLETAKDQIALFDNLPKQVQAEMVMEQVRGTDAMDEFIDLTDLYLTQNIDSIYSFIHDGDSYFARFEDEFLTNRNMSWIPKLVKIMKDEKAFIAVGAGHLGGPNGVVNLLRKEGYAVKPVKL